MKWEAKDIKPQSLMLCVRAGEAARKSSTMGSLDQNCSETQTRSCSWDLHNKMNQMTRLGLKLERISKARGVRMAL